MRSNQPRAWFISPKEMCEVTGIDFTNKYVHLKQENAPDYIALFSEVVVDWPTVLIDKNGKKIYEGDIADILTNSGVIKAVCVWNTDRACFEWLCKTYGRLNLSSVESKIFGNIHENGDLLK